VVDHVAFLHRTPEERAVADVPGELFDGGGGEDAGIGCGAAEETELVAGGGEPEGEGGAEAAGGTGDEYRGDGDS
jgi:hypothetical protein